MLFDSHVHTTFSVDADTTIAEAMRVSAEKNVGLVITDHMDWDLPAPFPDFRVDLRRFFQEYASLRSERLLLGVELGMTEGSAEKCSEIAAAYPFDFVLGSVHVLDGREVDDVLYRDRDERAVYREYLQTAAELIRKIDVDALAHVDYPLRSTAAELPFAEYEREFCLLFEAMMERKVCLELNTSRLSDKAAHENLLDIYRAYCEKGGRYVTLGSDAHEPQEIADNFACAGSFLRKVGLVPVHFCRRKMLIDK